MDEDELWHEALLYDIGAVDPDHPSLSAHLAYVKQREAEFTPQERRMIRAYLGLGIAQGESLPTGTSAAVQGEIS